MNARLLGIAFVSALIAACGSSETKGTAASSMTGVGGFGSSGQTGSSAGSSGVSAQAGSSAAGAGASSGNAGASSGNAGASTAGSAGTGGASAGSGNGATGGSVAGAATQGGSSSGGDAGTSSSQAGSTSAAGQMGAAGDTGAAGETGGGLEDGTVELDLVVTSGDQSTHITSCAPNELRAAVMEEIATNRIGGINCAPLPEGTLNVTSLSFQLYQVAVGVHDASELKFNCVVTEPVCPGVGDVGVSITDSNDDYVLVDAYQTSTKSGTFTIDGFTDDGRVSGSLDVTLSDDGVEVTIKGTFVANLRDCGPPRVNVDSCTGLPA